MLNTKECLEILNSNDLKYTKEETEQIRALLYQLAQLDYELFTLKMKEDERFDIRKSLYRRTG